MDVSKIISIFALFTFGVVAIVSLYVRLDTKIGLHRKESLDILRSMQADMKDFHGRLCAMEERNKNSRHKIIDKD